MAHISIKEAFVILPLQLASISRIAETLPNTIKILSGGLGVTFSLFFIVILLSIPLGLIVNFLCASKHAWIRLPARGYVFLMRGTPLMLQLLFFYFGLPYISPALAFDRFPTACLAFVLNYAAYFAEIFRGGIKSIDKGQYEAAQVLGLSRLQTVFKIVLPQMIKVAIPAVCNEAVTLVKDTALATTLGIQDLMHLTKAQVTSLSNVYPFAVAAVIYMIIIFALTKLFQYIEKKTNY